MPRRPKIAFQGEHGAFSEQAAHVFFSKSVETIPLSAFPDVFRAVASGKARYGIIPIENSLFGSIHQNYDLLQRHSLSIVGEIKLCIVHALLGIRKVPLGAIRTIYSHPQAIGQCERFLMKLSRAEAVPVYDTAGAAKMVKESGRPEIAAIASVDAARVYGLKVLRQGIESSHQNFTRFLVLAKRGPLARRNAKTSIIFSLKNIPGSLYKALSVFALRDINLYKIESRPLVGRPWDYLFYLDFQGSLHDDRCRKAISHLKEITDLLKILGSYPEGRTGCTP